MLFQSLYVARPVLNGDEISAWFKSQGLTTFLDHDDMHVTIAFSRKAVDWDAPGRATGYTTISNNGQRSVEYLGKDGALVMKFDSRELQTRWEQFRLCGASWDYPSYQPHMTLTYQVDAGIDPAGFHVYPGVIMLGPEEFKPLEATAVEKSRNIDDAMMVALPVIVKAHTDHGRRMLEVEASNESVDYDGDVILQKALLDSAPSFIARGHLDLDHLSEFGQRMGIPDPSSYIIGRPLEVRNLGEGRTGVVGEIRRSLDGSVNAKSHRYDDFWTSMQSQPPVNWQASVFGYPKPGMVTDCREVACSAGATRFLVEGFDWTSLALTRTPKNLGLKGNARIVSAKSMMSELAKSMTSAVPQPRSMGELWAARTCLRCRCHDHPNTVAYREHFEKCLGVAPAESDIFAHAIMHRHNKLRFAV